MVLFKPLKPVNNKYLPRLVKLGCANLNTNLLLNTKPTLAPHKKAIIVATTGSNKCKISTNKYKQAKCVSVAPMPINV